MISDVIISIALCYTITKLSVLVHELGHVFTLSITKKKLKLQVPIITSIFTFGLYGITFSPVYFYLKKFKYKKNIQKLIEFNATMGLIFEFIFLFTVLGISLFQFFCLSNRSYILICTGLFIIFLNLYAIGNSLGTNSDKRYFNKPKTFKYREFLPYINGKEAYIINPLSFFILGTTLSLIYYNRHLILP